MYYHTGRFKIFDIIWDVQGVSKDLISFEMYKLFQKIWGFIILQPDKSSFREPSHL